MTIFSIHTEQEYLKRLLEGDDVSLDYFYKQYSLMLYRKILKMVKLEHVAAEILQDLFVKLWHKRHLIDPGQSLKPYLYKMAENLVYDFYRKMARDQKLRSEVKKFSTEAYSHVEEEIYHKETNDILNQAIDNLPSQQKLVFILCKVKGESYKEVSESLGISTSTINSHIVKATKSIKKYMSEVSNSGFLLSLLLTLSCFFHCK